MSEASYRRYVLGQLRMARLRAKLLRIEIDTIGKAIKAGWVEPDDALCWLGDALELVQSEPAATIEWEAMHVTEDGKLTGEYPGSAESCESSEAP
jgi:hypothetical protein